MSTSGNPEEQPFRIYTAASVGHAIRHYRAQAGITQAELAERVGIDRTYLSLLERGHQTAQLTRILAILRQLGVKVTLQHEDW